MSESKKYTEEIRQRSMIDRVENRRIQTSREKFDGYDSNKWEHTYFNEETGGFLVTELARIPTDDVNKNIKDVFNKERSMCLDLANFGLGVRHMYEAPGISSPDISIERAYHSVVEINGKTADLKDLKNANNIRREAKDTFEKKKKADLIVFRFSEHDREIPNEIRKLSKRGWHGIYYYADENKRYDF